MINFQKTKFITSAAQLNQLVEDSLAEVAFAGRSNAGKSSAINAIVGMNGLAKTSKTPGRTQLINFFEVDKQRYLVDLPGYGYAKVPAAVKAAWQQTLNRYLEVREPLKALILIIDIRHLLKPFDQQMISWAIASNLPIHVILTKADKLSTNQAKQALFSFEKQIPSGALVTAQIFSALKKQGVDEARKIISAFLCQNLDDKTE
ncbi:MAG: YihA family ribosome biogenesis GTP-binding protein [Legionellales bacterium]|nr:YihA family ribosome biogenesis GTP-binding protein [Legionellales bacterium]|tara:strand:- start:157 stop:768 length:612 start_codon:yes stop_codon:yes gene_type:complete